MFTHSTCYNRLRGQPRGRSGVHCLFVWNCTKPMPMTRTTHNSITTHNIPMIYREKGAF